MIEAATRNPEALVQPQDFFRTDGFAPERVMGTEFEYDIQLIKRWVATTSFDQDSHSFSRLSDKRILEIFDFISTEIAQRAGFGAVGVDEGSPNVHVWLDNGDLIYRDGDLYELSSRESRGPQAAAAADAAGIFIVRSLVEHSGYNGDHRGIYRRTGHITPAHIDQAGWQIDDKETSTGHHLNLLTPAATFYSKRSLNRLGILADNLVTQVWGWNGMVGYAGYEWSQKWRGMGEEIATTNMGNRVRQGDKPMILLRCGANRDYDVNPLKNGWSRVEVRLADGSFSRQASFLKLAVGSLMMRLVEHWGAGGASLADKRLQDPRQALEDIATSKRLEARLYLEDGSPIYADELQEAHLQAVVRLVERLELELPYDELLALHLWELAIMGMRQVRLNNDLQPLAVISDTARKRLILDKRFDDDQLTIHNPQAVMLDTAYDRIDINPKTGKPGLGMQLAAAPSNRQADDQYVPDALVREAIHHPAATNTRAIARAAFVRQHDGERVYDMDWRGVQEYNRAAPTTYWPNPYNTGKALPDAA